MSDPYFDRVWGTEHTGVPEKLSKETMSHPPETSHDGPTFRIKAIASGDCEPGSLPERTFVDITVRIYETFDWHGKDDANGLWDKMRRASQKF